VIVGGVEDRPPDVDLDELVVGIRTLEVRPDRRGVCTDLGVPDEPRLLEVAHPVGGCCPLVDRLRALRRIRHVGAGRDLVEAGPVEVDLTEMLLRGARVGVDDPVAVDLLGERVEGSEQVVGDLHPPHGPVHLVPAGHLLGALDHRMLTRRSGIGDTAQVAEPGIPGPYPLAVDAAMHDDGVSRQSQPGGAADRAQWPLLRPNSLIRAGWRDVDCRWHSILDPSSVLGGTRQCCYR
jgi:hypothetical protein